MYISYINSKETKLRYVKNTHTHRCVEMRIKMLKIIGFGSGAKENMTMEAASAIASADLIVGYKTYVDILKQYFPDKEYALNVIKKSYDLLSDNGDLVLLDLNDINKKNISNRRQPG